MLSVKQHLEHYVVVPTHVVRVSTLPINQNRKQLKDVLGNPTVIKGIVLITLPPHGRTPPFGCKLCLYEALIASGVSPGSRLCALPPPGSSRRVPLCTQPQGLLMHMFFQSLWQGWLTTSELSPLS